MEIPKRTGTLADYHRRNAPILNTTSRDELTAAGVCVACLRAFSSPLGGVHCPTCANQIKGADVKAFRGTRCEIEAS